MHNQGSGSFQVYPDWKIHAARPVELWRCPSPDVPEARGHRENKLGASEVLVCLIQAGMHDLIRGVIYFYDASLCRIGRFLQ